MTCEALVACVLAGTIPSGTDTSIGELAEAYFSPELAGAGVDARGRAVIQGSLRLLFDEGTLHAVVAGDRVVGLYFRGRGSFRYSSADPFEASSFRHNVDEETDYRVDSGNAVSDTIEEALIMSSSQLETFDWEASGIPDQDDVSAFRKHLEEWARDSGVRYPHLMSQARIDPPPIPVTCVEMRAEEHDLIYIHDSIRNGDESLAIMEDTNVLEDWRSPRLLSVQPLGRSRLQPRQVRYMLVDLDVDVENPEGREAVVKVRETITARVPLRVVDLRLRSWIVSPISAPGGLEVPAYSLQRVERADGTALSHSHRNDDLVVDLGRRLDPDETVELVFEIRGDVLFRALGDNYWWLLSGWYPSPNLWPMALFTYHAVVKVPAPWIAFSNGRTVRRWTENSLHCAEFREEGKMGWATILAGKYSTLTDSREDLVVRVSSYARRDEESARLLSDMVHGLVSFYERLLGEFPWPELNVVEVHSLGFGQTPPGIIFITSEAFSRRDELTRLFSVGINRRIAHEVAHAWWGHVANLADPEDQWLSESTAEYYSAVAMANLNRKKDWSRALREWKQKTDEVGDRGSVYLANYVTGEGFVDHRTNLLYGKGPLILHAMRLEMEDDSLFFTILKSYLSSFRGQPARTKDFIGITNYITNENWNPWFERYLFGTAIPKVD